MIYSTNAVASDVCYVCGNETEAITNPDTKVPIPEKYGSSTDVLDCKTIALGGMNGSIPEDVCLDLHDSIDFKVLCGCRISSEFFDVPVGSPAMDTTPTFPQPEVSPTSTPSEANETNDPTFFVPEPNSALDMDTEKPTINVTPTNSPTDSQLSNEPTELPSTREAIDGDLDDIQSTEPSHQPSTAPSGLPSNVPSSVPSDAPSDLPSAQPTADRDISGVVVESSACTSTLLVLTHALSMVLFFGLMN